MSFPAYEHYKESGVEWLGKVPVTWAVKRLAHFFDERRTKVSDADYPALSVTKSGVVPQLETAAKTDDGDNRKLVLAGDFVINSRSDRKGSSGLSELDGSVSLINTVLEPRSTIVGRFAHHLLRSVAFQEEYYRYGKGIVADLWSTNFSEARNIILAVPAQAEQRAISAFLDRETTKIDALVKAQRRLIELLKEKRQAVISHAVTKGLNPSAPMKDSGVEWLGQVPAHWEVTPVKSLARLVGRIGYRGYTTEDIVNEGEGALAISPGNLRDGRIETRRGTYVTWEKFHESPEIMVESSDVVLVKTGSTYGKVAFFGRDPVPPATINPQMLLLKDARCGAEYMFMSLAASFAQASIESSNTGGTIPTITQEFVGNIRIAVPPDEEVANILRSTRRVLESVERMVREAEIGIALLQERRVALISAAVTGKIDVRGLGAPIQEADAA